MIPASVVLSALGLAALSSAQSTLDRSTWQAEANITAPTKECTDYSYAPVNDIIADYPPIWVTANASFTGALASDYAIYTAMEASIPDIAPRGTRDGNFTGVVYNMTSDPDCWWTDTKCTTPKLAGLVADISTCPEPNTWGFTLDDGPNCSHNAYYDYLNSIEQKATLFYIGSNVADWPLEGQRGLADGHEICAHTWSHPYMTSMTNEEAFAELYYSKKMIHEVLGITVSCWRPPYGDVDDRIRYIAAQLGMKTVIWDHDTEDWDYSVVGVSAVEANYQSIINGTYTTGGTIVLSHELDNETMSLSEMYLPQIRAKFAGVMPVGACQNWTEIYGEGSEYEYPNYAQWMAGTRTISIAAPTAFSSEAPFASAAVVTSSGLPASASATSTSSVSGTAAAKTATAAASASASATSTGSSSGAARVGAGAAALVAGAVGLAAMLG